LEESRRFFAVALFGSNIAQTTQPEEPLSYSLSLLIFLLSVFLSLFVSDFAKQTANRIFGIEK
jgi:hypothetical protein